VPFTFQGEVFHPGSNACWKTTTQGLERLVVAARVIKAGRTIRYKRRLDDFPAWEITNIWDDVAGASDKVYVVQTSTSVIA
jgi:adenine-specific DNA-methyltransferase